MVDGSVMPFLCCCDSSYDIDMVLELGRGCGYGVYVF